jgi:hypothetical protein
LENKISMNISLRRYILLILAVCFLNSISSGQEKKDSVRTFKNTIRINITNPVIFGNKYTVIGYERVLNKQQTFSVNAGRFALPTFINVNTGSLELHRGSNDKGLTFAFDYRFYLRKENKYEAPRGIYVGPYYAFNRLQRENTWSMNTANFTGDLVTNMRLNMNLVGAQLGYQFVIKKRIALDLILMGPGVWFYNLKTTINTTLNPDDESLLFEKINEVLAAKLPGHEILIQPGEFQKTGSFRASSAGFRYLIHIGFRF